MSESPEEPSLSLTLAWMGLGATVAASAFGVRPVRASLFVFWVVLTIGVLVMAMSWIPRLRMRNPRPELLAGECRRLDAALARLLAEQEHSRPRAGRFGGGANRSSVWLAETLTRYEQELRSWATKVFDQMVRAEVVTEASRPLLDVQSPLQLTALRRLFRDAAESLEQF